MIEHLDQAWTALTSDGAPFAMTNSVIDGVEMRTFTNAPPNMRLVWEQARQLGDRDYLVFEDERITYAEADVQVRALAAALASLGVTKGDRVAVAMRNYPEWMLSYWAIISMGASVVGMNAWWTPAEMEYALSDSQPKVLIGDTERIDRAAHIIDKVREAQPLALIAVRYEGDPPADAQHWNEVVDTTSEPDQIPMVEIGGQDDATVFYTSGTTGFPKGAQLTHSGSVHNLMNIGFMPLVQTTAMKLAAGMDPTPPTDEAPPVALAPTPLFHVTALNCVAHPITAAGGTLVLMYKWDAGRALELIEREKVAVFSGVPTMSREMLAHDDWATRDTSSMKAMGGGGAPLQPDLVGKIDKSLAQGAPNVGYGLTETHGIVTSSTAALYTSRPDSVGRAVPVADVKLIDADGNDLPADPDSVGELCVRGPIIVKGYLNKPEATAEAIREGWFRTGDVARIDEAGYIYIVDRVKDMVIRGGENVYCSEVESAIYEHPAVAEVAVFGAPDERLGESVAAAILVHDGHTLDHDELAAFLGDRISQHKIPERVFIRDEPLPRNANGKFVKRELQNQHLSEGSAS